MNRDTNNKKGADRYTFHKVCTSISGLDDIFYGGIDLYNRDINILIIGGDELRRTTFSLQLMYGISQYLKKIQNSKCTEYHHPFIVPEYFTTRKSSEYLEDLLLDMVISSSIQKITKYGVTDYDGKSLCINFSDTFFREDPVCADYSDSVYSYLPPAVFENTDKYLCEGAVYYSNRTNSLHFKTADGATDSYNILFERRHDRLSDYFKKKNDNPNNKSERSNIQSKSSNADNNDQDNEEELTFTEKFIDDVGSNIGMTYVNTKITPNISLQCLGDLIDGKNIVGLDLYDMDVKSDDEILSFIETFCGRKLATSSASEDEKDELDINNCNVGIMSIPEVSLSEDSVFPESAFDIIIDLRQIEYLGTTLHQLSVRKSRYQDFASGWHQYSLMDYGIEVYPNLSRFFHLRRYFQNSLTHTHSDVISDTFQQYLNNGIPGSSKELTYLDYKENKKDTTDGYLEALMTSGLTDYRSGELLEQIILCNNDYHAKQGALRKLTEHAISGIRKRHEDVTAIIGEANTYKRFFTFGGLFSNAHEKQHSLILLLSKDERTIRRRLSCPAMGRKCKADAGECGKCYKYIHFMSLKSGYISPEEFIFHLEDQLDTAYNDGKKIKKIIIDDLQMIEYAYPLLDKEGLFLSALISICKERNISLHILCDKISKYVEPLRALADNIIFTDRDTDGKSLIYIEKFAGYNNTPSKIYCGKIKSLQELFECYNVFDSSRGQINIYGIDSSKIEDRPVASMDDFWASCDSKYLANRKRKK